MKWTGSIKAKQVEIPEDLHAAVKAKAASMSIRTVDGYIDALDRWVSGDDPLQGFTVAQLRALRKFMKEPNRKSDKILGEVLQTILDEEYS